MMKLSEFVDHYEILGFSSSQTDCTKLCQAKIKAAYHKKALHLHPDKINRNPNSYSTTSSMTAAFQQLHVSYQLLMDKDARKKYDNRWLTFRHHEEAKKKIDDALLELQKKYAEVMKKYEDAKEALLRKRVRKDCEKKEEEGKVKKNVVLEEQRRRRVVEEKKFWDCMDKSKVLCVRWNRDFRDYTESELRKMFQKIGEVQEVRVKKHYFKLVGEKIKKRRGLALVFMSSTDSVIAATTTTWNFCYPPLDISALDVYSLNYGSSSIFGPT